MIDTTKKWFLLNAGQVTGPMTPEEIESHLLGATQPLVWGRGLADWMTPEAWRKAMKNLGAAITEVVRAEEPHWRYRTDGREFGPFNSAEFIDALKKVTDYSSVEITGEGFNGWREIYAVQKIVDELGITRRAHQRVPIMGTLQVESPSAFMAKVVSISEGGLGINDAPPLPIGEKIKGTMRSPHLFSEIPCTCEVVYAGSDGFTGLRFLHLPIEAQSAVIEYVNKFRNMGDR